jgi:hypothetical protein
MDRARGFPIADVDALERTDVLQDALIRCLDVLGETVKLLSPELREQNCDLPWLGMAGGNERSADSCRSPGGSRCFSLQRLPVKRRHPWGLSDNNLVEAHINLIDTGRRWA